MVVESRLCCRGPEVSGKEEMEMSGVDCSFTQLAWKGKRAVVGN